MESRHSLSPLFGVELVKKVVEVLEVLEVLEAPSMAVPIMVELVDWAKDDNQPLELEVVEELVEEEDMELEVDEGLVELVEERLGRLLKAMLVCGEVGGVEGNKV